MANARDQEIDKTYLSLDQAERRGFLHRDYLAHCLRWSHVCKYLYQLSRYKEAQVLDVGCGRELPLAKMLYSSRLLPKWYAGVDYGPINEAAKQTFKSGNWVFHERADFAKADLSSTLPGVPNLITCFEVLEHVEPRHAVAMLKRMHDLLAEDGVLFLSTPCYDEKVGPADNHVNELTFGALGAVLTQLGWKVHRVFGTFASLRDYEDLVADDGLEEVFTTAREYFDTNVLACLFAHRYPHRSRNCLWKLAKHPPENDLEKTKMPLFGPLSAVPEPWSSSTRWKELGDL